MVKKTLRACRRSLKDADISVDEVIEVVMVGGSTRVPLVRSEVEKYLLRVWRENVFDNARKLDFLFFF